MTIDSAIKELNGKEADIRFARLVNICTEFFGAPRIKGSHHIFNTPWVGSPFFNLQNDRGKAKSYQVRQVVKALDRLKELHKKSRK